MKKELSIQAYTVRDRMATAEQTADTFKQLASFGFTGIQTAGFPTTAEDYAAAAKAAGLRIVGTHASFDLLMDTAEAVRVHNILGTTNAGIGGMPGLWDADFNKAKLDDCIEKANQVGENLSKFGMKFTYHHHAKEFAKIGNETMMDILVRELDPKTCTFVLDTYWLQHGGVAILEWLEKLAGRVDILHLKDKGIPFGSNDGDITELGNGNINFKEVIRVAEATGVQEYCYEQDRNFVVNSLESARQSAEYFFSIV